MGFNSILKLALYSFFKLLINFFIIVLLWITLLQLVSYLYTQIRVILIVIKYVCKLVPPGEAPVGQTMLPLWGQLFSQWEEREAEQAYLVSCNCTHSNSQHNLFTTIVGIMHRILYSYRNQWNYTCLLMSLLGLEDFFYSDHQNIITVEAVRVL